MILWPPLGKCSWSSDSLAGNSVSQTPVCIPLVPMNYSNAALSLSTASLFVLAYSQPAFLSCPPLHILTLTRKTLLGCSLSVFLGQ